MHNRVDQPQLDVWSRQTRPLRRRVVTLHKHCTPTPDLVTPARPNRSGGVKGRLNAAVTVDTHGPTTLHINTQIQHTTPRHAAIDLATGRSGEPVSTSSQTAEHETHTDTTSVATLRGTGVDVGTGTVESSADPPVAEAQTVPLAKIADLVVKLCALITSTKCQKTLAAEMLKLVCETFMISAEAVQNDLQLTNH